MPSFKTSLLILLSVMLFSACGISRRSGQPSIKTPASSKPLESGVSSWYGPNFHGKLTANGEVYDMYGFTAAHRTLPFGTILLVKNLDNDKTVQVRINDRGPYAKDRIIDLSKSAAEEIDMIGPGTARVQLFVLKGDIAGANISDLKVPTYTVQLGSFKSKQEALAKSGLVKGSRVEDVKVNGEVYFRVYSGIYKDVNKAKSELNRLERMGLSGFVKQIENN